MNRRNLFSKIVPASIVGLGLTEMVNANPEPEHTEQNTSKSLYEIAYDITRNEHTRHIVYVNVGNLPKLKAQAFLDKVRDEYKKEINTRTTFIPVRNDEHSRMEVATDSFTVDDVLKNFRKLQS